MQGLCSCCWGVGEDRNSRRLSTTATAAAVFRADEEVHILISATIYQRSMLGNNLAERIRQDIK